MPHRRHTVKLRHRVWRSRMQRNGCLLHAWTGRERPPDPPRSVAPSKFLSKKIAQLALRGTAQSRLAQTFVHNILILMGLGVDNGRLACVNFN
jgi:hypothetical protein